MYFDITTPDTAYDWIYEALKINSGQFIEDYILKCHKNIDMFCELYDKQIEKLDVENIEVVAFQVTSCNDYCASIKKNGIRNLQWVLNNETEMKDFFFENGISFDLSEKKMCAYGQEYSIDYEQYQGKHHITDEEDCIERIAHKVFYDFQINAFLFCKDIAKYSTICSMPEFIYTVSNLSKDAEKMRSLWKRERKAYVIKYKSYIKNFACFTFYESESDYEEDVLHGFIKLKKKLISLAIIGMHGELRGDVFVYMEPLKSVLPENILEIVSAEEWRKNVLKYFGETGNL